MKSTNQNVYQDGSYLITADGRRLVAGCGGYAENLANAKLLGTAWNVLRELNPANPLAAAKALPDMVTALKHMLHIFDRELPEDTFGRRVCDEAIAALAALKGETDGN